MNKLPDRWLPYRPFGSVIEGTRFIAFKVPLNKRFFHSERNIPSKDQFTPQILLNEVQDLGIVIDLTATTRYYNPREFEDNDVLYIKIFTQGHQVPSYDVVAKFTTAVNKFLERNGHNDKKIGVHCTHGINRTGYLICHYMINQMKIDSKEAINRFGICRGYPIERTNYIESLNSLVQPGAAINNDGTVKRRNSLDKRDNLSIERDRQNRKNQNGIALSRAYSRDRYVERRAHRSRSKEPNPLSLCGSTSSSRRISRVSRVTVQNDRVAHTMADRTQSCVRPRDGNQRCNEQSFNRDRSRHNIRNPDYQHHGDQQTNGDTEYRTRRNSNERPPIGVPPSRNYNRYHWTPRNNNKREQSSSQETFHQR